MRYVGTLGMLLRFRRDAESVNLGVGTGEKMVDLQTYLSQKKSELRDTIKLLRSDLNVAQGVLNEVEKIEDLMNRKQRDNERGVVLPEPVRGAAPRT